MDLLNTLELASVTVHAGATALVNAVSVSVSSGEVLGVIGPNGAGKTTLLSAVSGSIALSSGAISIAGQPLGQIDARQRACQLAVLPQFSSLSFPFTVEEVVTLSRIPHSTGRQCDHQIVREALQAMGILPLRNRLYTQLSGGEKQRVQLARVMAQIWRNEDASGMRILLLDEPASALDLHYQQQLMQVVRGFADQGAAVLIVIHDINLVARYADTLLALSNGRAIACGQPKDVIKAEIIKQLYAVDVHIINHPEDDSPVIIAT